MDLETEARLKFSFKDKVKVTKGFYRGFKGEIQGWVKQNDKIFYKVHLEDEDKTIDVEERNLKIPNILGL